METYKVVRKFFDDAFEDEVLDEGLDLHVAQIYCKSPQSSSRTATEPELVALTEERGAWFNGYEEE